MSLYRCAACGSPNVIKDRQNAGIKYDYVKGAVGTLVLGAGGAVAGITNNTSDVFVCPDCGARLTEPMPDSIKSLIEIGLLSKEARDHLSIGGATVYWQTLKQQYKNIEEGVADRIELAEKEAIHKSLLSGSASKHVFNAAWDKIVHYAVVGDALKSGIYDEVQPGEYTDKNPLSLKEYRELLDAIHIVAENAPKYIPTPLSSKNPGPYPEAWWLLERIVAEYIFLHAFELTGKEIVNGLLAPQSNTVSIETYTNINPYITELLKKYGLMWTYKNASDSEIARSILNHALFHRMIYIDTGDGSVQFYYPKFKMENDHLYYNNTSFAHSALYLTLIHAGLDNNAQFEILKTDYFSVFPEKEAIFDQMLMALIREYIQIPQERNENLEIEIDSLCKDISKSQARITQNETEAKKLAESGFFGRGKVKHKDRIEELLLQAKQESLKIDTLKEKMSELQEQESFIDECTETVKAYTTALLAMDYLMVWHQADD